MLFIFVTLVGVAVVSPIVALRFAISSWFVPATHDVRDDELGRSATTHFSPEFALSYFD